MMAVVFALPSGSGEEDVTAATHTEHLKFGLPNVWNFYFCLDESHTHQTYSVFLE